MLRRHPQEGFSGRPPSPAGEPGGPRATAVRPFPPSVPLRQRLGFLAVVLVLPLSGCEAPDPPPRRGGPEEVHPLTRYVDPFIGTGGHGHVYPGATVPFGMVQLSPDQGRNGWDWVSGYHWEDSVLVGFSHTHLSGTGIGDLLDILLMPLAGPISIHVPYHDRFDRPHSRFSHQREEAQPGYYAVDLLDHGIRAELTTTARVGFHRYTFSEGARPTLFLDLGYAQNWDAPVTTGLKVLADTLLTGYRFSKGWAPDQRVFFALALSRPLRTLVLSDSATPLASGGRGPGVRGGTVQGKALRALLSFDSLGPGRQLLVKVGISYVDEAGALANLQGELPGWDFEGVRRAARRSWERELRKIRLRGGSETDRKIFYTALYRTRLAPVLFQDLDGRYRGADGKIHTARDYRKHEIFSLWDTFRAQHPLFTLLDADRVDDLIRSMLSFRDEYGLLPVWSLAGNETNTMTGNHAVPVVAEAWRKGFRGFDGKKALQAMVESQTQQGRGVGAYVAYGFVPSDLEVESVTKTLELAFDDWAVASMALDLGEEEVFWEFQKRSLQWRNVFDPQTRFMRGRTSRGEWTQPFDPRRSDHREGTDYTEGNAWQHTWFVPHDVRGLIAAMGGDGPFLAKLDSLFELDTLVTGERPSPDISGMIGQYAHGNEPSHHIAYLYNFAGAPWKTADRVRTILTTQYRAAPDGLSGNEDCGQMSAWYIFSALGFYPVNPAAGVYVIGTPLFPEAVLDLGGGRTFTVRAPGVSETHRYIRSARLNGRPLPRSWLHHHEIARGGRLELDMGPEPSSWGTAPGARPPSGFQGRWSDREMAEAVKTEFLHAWRGYWTFARGYDALRPLSGTGRNWYARSLLMTPVDAFDTMLLMGLGDEAAQAKELILRELSFDHDFFVQVFEVTIRLLGGLLSAYELDGDQRFLQLATDLGNRLLPAFDSPTAMPYVMVNLRTGEKRGRVNNPAEIGTLLLEFGILSRHTGNPVYYEKAKRGMQELFRRRSPLGLVGTTIDVETGQWQDRSSHLSGRIDSWYEYLYKGWLLFGDEDLRSMWEASIGPVHRYLAHEVDGRLWYGQVHMDTGQRLSTRFGALDAFWPGVLALSGDLGRASRLMESVHFMWTRFDVEPEQMDYLTFEVVHGGYPLRPEALESAYVLHALTGDPHYKALGWDIFRRIVRYCRTERGYAHLRDVRSKEKSDDMESFFLAETLKYAWLLFAPSSALDFHDVVFNTEAHPFRRQQP